MEMGEENIDEGQKIDLYYHDDQVNAIREREIYIHIRKTRVKKSNTNQNEMFSNYSSKMSIAILSLNDI